MNLVDTSGWIEYLFARPNADLFAPPIEDTERLLVPVICLYEVFKKVMQEGDERRACQCVVQMRLGRILPITDGVALEAALLSIRHRLPMADSLIYATAMREGAVLWTQDRHFDALPGVRYIAPRPLPPGSHRVSEPAGPYKAPAARRSVRRRKSGTTKPDATGQR